MLKHFRAFVFITLSALAPVDAYGQNPQAGPGGQARVMGIDLATARRAVAAAEAAAVAANARVSIAVVDANGDLVLFERMDGAAARAVTTAQGKARAAILFGMPTRDVADAVAAGRPVTATVTLPIAGAWELTPMQGGLPILRDGKVVAAIGVGGAAPTLDEQFAQAGLDAIGGGQ